MKCDTPIQTINGMGQCRNCPKCKSRHRRHFLGRLAAEAHTADFVRFVTLTYNDENLADGRSLPTDHVKLYCQNRRQSKLCFKHFTVGEYGDKTDRPHWHSLQFLYGKQPPEPLGFSDKHLGWTHGNSCYELPRSLAGSAAYLYDYLDKGGRAMRPSPGLGKRFLINFAHMQARHRRKLCNQYGIPYTVPGVARPDGVLWQYTIARGHRYAVAMAEAYIEEWQCHWDDLPDFNNLGEIQYDG